MANAKYLVVGGGLAGLHAALAIRERDSGGRIVLVSNEHNPPYDRVPLSKGYLTGNVKKESLFPRKPGFFEEKKVELLLGRSAESLDLTSRKVSMDDGEDLSFEKLLLATGGHPRHLGVPGDEVDGVRYLRTLEDCEALRHLVTPGKRVVVAGGGFIGCEAASAFASMGADVTVVEALPRILGLAFEAGTSEWVEARLLKSGLKIRNGDGVKGFRAEDGRLTTVETTGGGLLPADLALVAVGIVPDVGLAEKAGLEVDRGIVVDSRMETGTKGVFAAGDVAKFWHPAFGRHIRLEHYDVAVKQGKIAGANMAGASLEFTEPPHFFSHLPGVRIDAYGDISAREAVIQRGTGGDDGSISFYFAGGRMRGFLSANSPPTEIKEARRILAVAPALEGSENLGDESVPLNSLPGTRP